MTASERVAEYRALGCPNRRAYIAMLAEERGLDVEIVATLADLLGPDKDFSRLINELDSIIHRETTQ